MDKMTSVEPTLGLPILTNSNYLIWKYSVNAFAEEKYLSPHLNENVTIPTADPGKTREIKKRAQAGRLTYQRFHKTK